jgi:translation initiation factor 2B subunit (eIF-2B alpha/beta/delta family)
MAISSDLRRRIESIRDDRRSGARELAREAAETLSLAARSAPASVGEVAEALIAAQPSMAPMVNLARRAAAAGDVPAACREFLDAMDRAGASIAARAAALIADGMTVLTHSSSSTVLAAFERAREAGTRFSVIAGESRPQLEGVSVAGRLGRAGIPVTLIADAAVSRSLPRAQLVFVGADSVSAESVVNKIGTALVALAARALDVPVYVLCGSEKFLPASYALPPEPAKNPREILDRELPNVTPENYYFEAVPRAWFTGIVTEDGILGEH